MEVHPPDHPINTPRDFFLHLFTITIGLLIALSLEGGVEALHHRHIVHQARENIRHEIQLDHEAAQQDFDLIQKNIERQKANIQAIRSLRADPKNFHGAVSNTMDFDSMNDSAFRTARDTAALTYMPYDEVQRYSDIYMMGDLVNKHAIDTAERDFIASAPFEMGYDPSALPDADYDKLLHSNAEIMVELSVLKQIVQQFDDACLKELKN